MLTPEKKAGGGTAFSLTGGDKFFRRNFSDRVAKLVPGHLSRGSRAPSESFAGRGGPDETGDKYFQGGDKRCL